VFSGYVESVLGTVEPSISSKDKIVCFMVQMRLDKESKLDWSILSNDNNNRALVSNRQRFVVRRSSCM